MAINYRLCVVLLCCISAVLAAVPPVSSNIECPYEPLPTSFDSLSALGFNGELHLHNEYFTSFTRGQSHQITFTITQQSAFRIYIEPHYVDIDIWLYKTTSTQPVAKTSDYSLADEVVFATLDPGSYKLKIYFFDTFKGDCPTMMMEASIVPTANLTQRISNYTCPATQSLPDINFGVIGEDGFVFPGGVEYVAKPTGNSTFNFFQSYKFTVPSLNLNGNWEIEAVLGLHFPTSSMGLLLQDVTATNPTNLACFDVGNCSIAVHNAAGQSTLKVLVLPGTYVLWLYDVPRDRDTSLISCHPFTFSLEISRTQQIEDYLNCDAEPFPANLDEAGLMDDNGYMYYREDVLIDLTQTINQVKFTVKQDSYFRSFVAEHRIDLDLKLLDSNYKQVAYGSQYGSTEEGIQAKIAAGTYIFQFILFGKYEDVFCESALLEIAIAPVALFKNYDVCTGQAASTPDLSGLATLQTSPSFVFPYSTFRYIYTGSTAQNKVIAQQQFTISADSYVQVELGSNFLLGDIRVWLTTSTNDSRPPNVEVGYHRRNMHFIDVLLPKSIDTVNSTYTLSIVTYDTQATAVVGFPTCATYSLSFSVLPANATAPKMCLKNRRVPSNLNTPQNLLTSPKIHIQEEFLVPKIANLYTTETMTFSVNVTSYFRMYTEPHHIDIDLKLVEGTTTNGTKGQNFNGAEAIVWELKPFVNYTVTLSYYKWYFVDHGNDPCYTFQAEFSITPLSENTNLAVCTTNNLPNSNLGKIVRDQPIYFENEYNFTQTTTPLDYVIKFEITEPAMLRVAITYDFVWNALGLKLNLPGTTDPIYGDLDYNRNEIPVLQLAPGNYSLHIFDAFDAKSTKAFALHNCVQFYLTLGLEVIVDDEVDPLLMTCEDQYFPASFNAPGFLHSLSGNMLDFNRDILADVTDRVDSVSLNLPVDSVLRLYIPVDPVLDIDIVVYKGTKKVAQQTSYGKEETILVPLTGGYYTLNFTYFGAVASNVLPPASACSSFRIAIGIHPTVYLNAVPALSASCSTNFTIPTIAPTTALQTSYFTRSLETQVQFNQYLDFTLKSNYLFTALFEFNEGSTGISMILEAKNVTRTYYPLYFSNQAYLNEYLAPGTYRLTFKDPLGTNTVFKCAPYVFSYSLVLTDKPATCSGDQLPSDLFTVEGGSTQFGGPQDTDGSIHLFGENFYAEKGTKVKDNYILFKVPKKSYLRIFLAVETLNTITANLYRDTNLTSATPFKSMTVASSAARSTVWTMPKQPNPYVLDIKYTTVGNVLNCNFYTLEFVLEPETAVLEGLACPNPLPAELYQLPPETINVQAGQDYRLSSDFIITSAKYAANSRGGNYTYTMTINVASNSTLEAILAYDFIINNFDLKLFDANSRLLINGIPQESPETDSGNNFMSYLQWNLGVGTYRLTIVDTKSSAFNLTTFCHSFSMALTIAAANSNPRVLQINPSSGKDLNYNVPLTLTLTFSEAVFVALPNGTALAPYLADNLVVYLQPNAGDAVTAVEAFFDLSSTLLTLRFTQLTESASYTLKFDLSKFATSRSNASFAAGPLASSHKYSMYQCSGCSGHGSCAQNRAGQWACVCSGNWTGLNCEKCAAGTHGEYDQCVPNRFCQADSCNNHGSCDDSAGYPICICEDGYLSPDCQPGCAAPCVHGLCLGGICQCAGNFTGKTCNECKPQFSGANCDKCASGYAGEACEVKMPGKESNAGDVVLAILGVMLGVGVIGGGAYWYYKNRHRAMARYRLANRFSVNDDEEVGGNNHQFPSSDNRLVEDDDDDTKRFVE